MNQAETYIGGASVIVETIQTQSGVRSKQEKALPVENAALQKEPRKETINTVDSEQGYMKYGDK